MSYDTLRQQTVDIVRRYIDAINAWDFELKRTLLAPDVIFEMPFAPEGFQRRFEGADAYLAFARQAKDIVGDENLHDVHVETLASDPGEAICFYRGDMTIQASGAPYKNQYISRFTVRDGKITRFAEYYDPIPLIVALGGSVRLETAAL